MVFKLKACKQTLGDFWSTHTTLARWVGKGFYLHFSSKNPSHIFQVAIRHSGSTWVAKTHGLSYNN